MTNTADAPVKPGVITIARQFDVPREKVFEAWTTPEQFASWWGPAGFTTPLDTVSIDARAGGRWQATMISDADGMEIPFFGVYHEVVEPEKLVFSLVDPADAEYMARRERGEADDVTTIELKSLGDRSELSFTQVGQWTEEDYGRTRDGWASFFDCLENTLAKH